VRRWASVLASYAAMAAGAALFLAPVVFMVVGSLKPDADVLAQANSLKAFVPESASAHNFVDVLGRVEFLRYMANSLLITAGVVGGGLVVNSMAAYAFARLRWRGRELLLAMVLAVMIIPLEAIAVPLFYGAALLGWRDTYSVQIVPFIANAFAIYLFYSYFIGLPRELEEAARIDGAGPLRTFFSIVAPNARPAFASVAIVTFLTQWGAYLWPLMVTSGEAVRPLPVAIATFYTLPPRQWGDIMAFGVMMITPVLVTFVLFQKWFVRGVASTGVKG
jgi:multiple sugar transport system permease protein